MSNKKSFTHKVNLPVGWAAVIVVLALCIAGLDHATPPRPIPASSSASVFSSARALIHVHRIAQQPHPLGTAEHAKVRDYLVTELKNLGLAPQIQTALAINNQHQHRIVGRVQNILVRIHGKVPNKALLVTAHYDSTHTGPGAADDGASVAAILETLRALNNLPKLQNDIICIFTDGEEAGLLGAKAFVQNHPWAKHIGLVLNFEYRGNRGPMLMFETSQGNGRLIDGLALAATRPLGNSLMHEVYKRMPNDTDLTVFKQAGIAGMNFAAIEGYTSYHTQLDRPELLQEASLQHQGETMLSLVQHFGNTDLVNIQSSDSVYFDAPGLGMVHYSVSWAFGLCIVTIALFCTVILAGIKCGAVRATGTALAALAFLIIVPVLSALSQLLWIFLKFLHPQYQLMLQGDTYNSNWYLPAFVLLTIAQFVLVQSNLKRWICPMELAAGAMFVWLILLIATSILLPGASFLFFWPLAPALTVLGLLFLINGKNMPPTFVSVLFILATAPGIVIFAPFIKALFIGLTPNQIAVVTGFLALFLGLIAPLLDLLTRSFVLPSAPLIIGLVLLITGSFHSGFDTEHPRPNHLFYAQDSVSGKAFWLSNDKSPDEWTRSFFPDSNKKRQIKEIFGEKSTLYWVGSAPVLFLQAPKATVLKDTIMSGMRKINIQVRSLRNAPELRVYLEGASVLSSKVENRVFSQKLDPDWSLQGFGLSEMGLNIELNVGAGSPFQIRVIDFSYGLPRTNLPPRPENTIPQLFSTSDTTAVANAIAFK
jgi:hypothetical protein